LEERLENERLNEEFGLPGQPPDEISRLENKQESSSSRFENLQEESVAGEALDLAVASETTTDEAPGKHVHPGSPDPVVDHPLVEDLRTHKPSAADHMLSGTAEERVPQNHLEIQLWSPPAPQDIVEIQSWSFERGQWRKSDHLLVDPSDTSPIERLARK
jgi:hypothetical protein